jgi:hypothetical protein
VKIAKFSKNHDLCPIKKNTKEKYHIDRIISVISVSSKHKQGTVPDYCLENKIELLKLFWHYDVPCNELFLLLFYELTSILCLVR